MKGFRRGCLIIALSSLITSNLIAGVNVKIIKDNQTIIHNAPARYDIEGNFVGDNIQHVTQLDSSYYENVNCGPACISMIGTYYDKKIDIVDLNNFITPSYKGYSTISLEKMMQKYGIKYSCGFLEDNDTKKVDDEVLVNYIDGNRIALLAIDTQYVRTKADLPESRTISSKIGRSYTGASNHFILCTGYIRIDGKLYYQVLDPLEYGYTYIPANDLAKAIEANWPYCYLFEK